MKIAPKQAAEFLKQPTRNCGGLLLYGPDTGLVRERMHLVVRAVLGEHYDPMCLTELSDEQLKADPALLSDELCAASLLADKRVVVVRDASDRLAKPLEALFSALPGGAHYLVLCTAELSPRSALRVLAEGAPNMAAVACYKDEAMDLSGVIRRKLDEAGIRVGRDVVEYLQQQLGNDRYVTYSELDKLVLYAGEEKQMTLETVMQLVGNNRDVDLDVICMAALSGDAAMTEKNLTQGWREGMQPVAILRAMQRQAQRLYSLRVEMDSGHALDQVIANVRPPIFFRHTQAVAAQVRSRSLTEIAALLTALAKAELDVKSGTLPPALITGQLLLMVARRAQQRMAA